MQPQVADPVHAEHSRAVVPHRERVRVLEAEGAHEHDAFRREQLVELVELTLPILGRIAVHHGRPERARVVDVGVEVAGAERVEGDGRAERGAHDRARVGGSRDLPREHLGEDVLLGEGLRADDDRRMRAEGERREAGHDGERDRDRSETGTRRCSTSTATTRTTPSSTSASAAAATQPTAIAV